jgi:hypothetical protein
MTTSSQILPKNLTIASEEKIKEEERPSRMAWKSVITSKIAKKHIDQRPEAESWKGFEEPLRPPVNMNNPTAFRDVKAVIAMDVSGSTKGKVIEQEIKAAQTICSNLSPVSSAQTTVIPWDHRIHTSITAKHVHRLRSQGGGTRPSVLASSGTCVNTLGNCSAWLLFTDGEIANQEIREFSRGLCSNGLHGTACIIVLFGYRCQKPVDCNISVGISIFGIARDCLFLFHDVESGIVYVLQSKGTFNKLLRNGGNKLSLEGQTNWWDLPTINYSELSQIDIPAPRKLDSGTILLQSNLTVRLKDIYSDKVDTATANEILENDDNLKTLLLTSEINGQNDSIKTWIVKQKMKGRDILHIPRPDINNSAETFIRKLLAKETCTMDLDQKKCLQTQLRIAHKNWIAFLADTDVEQKTVKRREEIVHKALDRVTSNAVQSSRGSWTPRMISPISIVSAESKKRFPVHDLADVSLNVGDSPANFSPDTDILFIPGYKYNRYSASPPAFEGECPICGETGTILSLLVKEPAITHASPGFPLPNSRAVLDLPLSLSIGTYSEAEALSPFISCNSCAYVLVQMKTSPITSTEKIIGAIPLVPGAICGESKQMTIDILDKALAKRFEKDMLELVFLSMLHFMEMNTSGDGFERTRKMALRWAARLLANSISVPLTLTNTCSNKGGLTQIPGASTLRQVLSNILDGLFKPNPLLFQYSLGNFMVIIQIMMDLNLDPDPSKELLKNAVFHRILYHIVEKLHESLAVKGRDTVMKDLRSLIWSPSFGVGTEAVLRSPSSLSGDGTEAFEFISTSAPLPSAVSLEILSVPLSSLTATFLFPIKDFELLSKLDPLLNQLTSTSTSFALSVFLYVLFRETWTRADLTSTPMEIFNKIRAEDAFSRVFEIPLSVREEEARALIGAMWFGTETRARKGNGDGEGDRNTGGAGAGENEDFEMVERDDF